jgi:hypothetical protein
MGFTFNQLALYYNKAKVWCKQHATVFDASNNQLTGSLPFSLFLQKEIIHISIISIQTTLTV